MWNPKTSLQSCVAIWENTLWIQRHVLQTRLKCRRRSRYLVEHQSNDFRGSQCSACSSSGRRKAAKETWKSGGGHAAGLRRHQNPSFPAVGAVHPLVTLPGAAVVREADFSGGVSATFSYILVFSFNISKHVINILLNTKSSMIMNITPFKIPRALLEDLQNS